MLMLNGESFNAKTCSVLNISMFLAQCIENIRIAYDNLHLQAKCLPTL